MTKQEFTKLIRELVEIKNAEDGLNKAFKKFEPDFTYIGFGRYETLVVKSLEFAMEDKYQWISYWLYECDCGKENKKVTDKYGKNLPIKTISNLYDLIKKESF